ncbi:SSI family serine proteinase inhibitor (plasmid) [Streptomyces sp. CA-294286]|uniref:SSI family serine proteinase inhibitor n=1 Tax=Streptomyces sp. CA-294286 TaxID=3240070 RepID=UPI003D94151E
MALASIVALTGTAVAPAAQASGTSGARANSASLYAPTALVLSVHRGDAEQVGAVQRAVTLSCLPVAGTHPAPKAACAELNAVQGDLSALGTATPGRMCTKQWDPVTVTVEGVLRGERVHYVKTFGNSCMKDAAESAFYSF